MLPLSRKDSPLGKPDNTVLCLRFVARRYLVFGVTVFLLFSLFLRVLYNRPRPLPSNAPPALRWPGKKLPPLYPQYHRHEHNLPQHHWNTPSHEAEPKYFWIAGHGRGSGWGNVMQEVLLNAYLTHQTDRAYVFHNYSWNEDGSDYSDYAGKPIPSRIPMSALIRGPIVGGEFPPGDNHPLAVSEEYWYHACGQSKRVFPREEVHEHLPSWYAHDITEGWIEKMKTVDDQCVEVAAEEGQLYNWVTFGDRDAMHGLWSSFAQSPIITHFGWSALVELAFDNNREVFSPTDLLEPPLSAQPYTTNAARYTELPGLLVLHLRRGDYAEHCEHLAKWSSQYLAFNALPGLPDRFDPPPGGEWGENTPENHAIYREHCFPSVAQIVRRVENVARTDAAAGLRHVYIMTNGAVGWVEELKTALGASGRWTHVASSRDLVLSWEQKYVAQAVDMLVGQRAQVFIGNGWSSLTGNIVVMRHANGFRADSTRFW